MTRFSTRGRPNLSLKLSFLALGLCSSCTITDNPRDPGSTRRQQLEATVSLLAGTDDVIEPWQSRVDRRLRNGIEWATLLEGESLGGALIRMLSLDKSALEPRPVCPNTEVISDPIVSPSQRLLFYRRAGDSQVRIARLPDLDTGELSIDPGPFERSTINLREARQVELACWAPARLAPRKTREADARGLGLVLSGVNAIGGAVVDGVNAGVTAVGVSNGNGDSNALATASASLPFLDQDVLSYYEASERKLVVVVFSSTEPTRAEIIARLEGPEPFSRCLQIAWLADGERVLSLWQTPRDEFVTCISRLGSKMVLEAVGNKDSAAPGEWQTIRLVPCPTRLQIPWREKPGVPPLADLDQVLVEMRRQEGDRNLRRVDLWDLETGRRVPLPGLTASLGRDEAPLFTPRWCGPRRLVMMQVDANVGFDPRSRWKSWKVRVYSRAQALGLSSRQPAELANIDYSALGWDIRGEKMDRQLIWTVQGEAACYIDPDTERNVKLSDHRNRNVIELLRGRGLTSPKILSIQLVSTLVPAPPPDADDDAPRPPSERWVDNLYILEEAQTRGSRPNFLRLTMTPFAEDSQRRAVP